MWRDGDGDDVVQYTHYMRYNEVRLSTDILWKNARNVRWQFIDLWFYNVHIKKWLCECVSLPYMRDFDTELICQDGLHSISFVSETYLRVIGWWWLLWNTYVDIDIGWRYFYMSIWDKEWDVLEIRRIGFISKQ